MKRRLAFVLVGAALLMAGGAPASAIVHTGASSYWGCVVADDVDLGLCLKNPVPRPLPLPERLPVPSVPSVPSTPPAPTPA